MAVIVPRGPFARFAAVAALLVFIISFSHYMGVVPVPESVRSRLPGGDHNKDVPNQQPLPPSPPPPRPKPDYSGSPQCIPELEYLKRPSLDLTSKIKFRRRCIRPVFSTSSPQSSTIDPNAGPVDRDTVTNVTTPLIDSTVVNIDLHSCEGIADDYIPCDILDLAVPDPYPEQIGQYSHLLFAIATSLNRLKDAKAYFVHWMAGTGSTLIVLVTDRPNLEKGQTQADIEEDWPAVVEGFAAAGVLVTLVPPHSPDHSVVQSHMMMIADMLTHVRQAKSQYKDTHWLCIFDDDTFVPAMEPLSLTLAKYDHKEPAYLGQLSESWGAVRYGMAGFGGAGIFISVPLAEELEPHLDECRTGRGGDMQIMVCIHDHTHARLQRVKGLQQQDIHGDLGGWFESGWRFLTLHHWKSWYQAPVLDMAKVAMLCGGCFLQRWRFPDFASAAAAAAATGDEGGLGDSTRSSSSQSETDKPEVVFTNGYSITRYHHKVPDLTWKEGTWENAETEEFRWSLGPIRPRLNETDKTVWRLVESVSDKTTGGLTQIYVHRDTSEKDAVDEVIELVWSAG